MDFGFFGQSLAVQVALAAGYLGYCTAYAGYRRGHLARDAIFISLVFASIASVAFVLAEAWGTVAAGLVALLTSLACACLWRMVGRKVWLWAMRASRVHREDGVHSAWDGLLQSGRAVTQLTVHTRGGDILYLTDRAPFKHAPWEGIYLGGDGSIVMAVDEEVLGDGKLTVRDGILSDGWGARMTYLPPSEIARIEIRLK